MPVTSYGAYNPNAVDPWPIEQTLAPLAVGGSQAEAQNMLNMYQKQREAAGNVYGDELARQHEFNRQQLAQQLYEAKLKEQAPLLNAPGGAHLLGPGGIAGLDMSTDPTVMQGVISAADAAQQAKAYEAAGKGTEGFSNAGYMVPANSIPGLQPNIGTVQTENARIAQERLRSQTSLAVAGMHAANQRNQEGKATVGGPLAFDAEGNAINVSRRVPFSQVDQAILEQQQLSDRMRQNRSGGGSGSSLQTAPGAGNTSAQPAPSGGGPARLDTSSPEGRKAQDDAMRKMDQMGKLAPTNPAAKKIYDDVNAGRQGAVYTTNKLPSGQTVVTGKSGTHYDLGR